LQEELEQKQEDATLKDRDEKKEEEEVNGEEPGAIVDTESVMARQSPSPAASTKVPESLEEISPKSPTPKKEQAGLFITTFYLKGVLLDFRWIG